MPKKDLLAILDGKDAKGAKSGGAAKKDEDVESLLFGKKKSKEQGKGEDTATQKGSVENDSLEGIPENVVKVRIADAL